MQAKNQGENLAYFKPYKEKCQGPKREDCVQCREIVDDWYDEVKNYDFGMGKPKTPGGVVMHFTQVPVQTPFSLFRFCIARQSGFIKPPYVRGLVKARTAI